MQRETPPPGRCSPQRRRSRGADVNPGVTRAEFESRRQAFFSRLPPSSVAIVMSAHVQYMAGVIPRQWRQSSDMRYLSGVDAPGAVAVFEAPPGPTGEGRWTLFHPPRDDDGYRWNGTCLSADAARDHFGADDAVPTGSPGEAAVEGIVANAACRGAKVYLCPESRAAAVLPTSLDAHAASSSAGATTSFARRLVRAAVAAAGGQARTAPAE